MITTEMAKKAIATAHANCKNSNTCVHAETVGGCSDEVQHRLAKISDAIFCKLEKAGKDDLSSPDSIAYVVHDLMVASLAEGVHIGYRLAQIELGIDEVKEEN